MISARIKLPQGGLRRLSIQSGMCERMVYRALTFSLNSLRARKVRCEAVNFGQGTFIF